jgi:hypothetical protein
VDKDFRQTGIPTGEEFEIPVWLLLDQFRLAKTDILLPERALVGNISHRRPDGCRRQFNVFSGRGGLKLAGTDSQCFRKNGCALPATRLVSGIERAKTV